MTDRKTERQDNRKTERQKGRKTERRKDRKTEKDRFMRLHCTMCILGTTMALWSKAEIQKYTF